MSDYVRADFHDWCKEHEGESVRIEPEKKPVSQEMRGYYFGAVLPLVRSTCDDWKNLTTLEMHEVVKKMFFYFETYNPKTKRTERFGRSVMAESDWNNTRKAMEFLQVIAGYLAECGIAMPNPEEYKKWRDESGVVLEKIDYPENNLGEAKF